MSTAVTTPSDDAGKNAKQAEVPAPASGGFTAHKPGEGYATRLGMMVVVMAYVAFACHHWYYNWVYLRNFIEGTLTPISLGVLVRWTYDPTASRVIATLGTLTIAAAGFAVAYFFIYVKRRTAEFLIKTDGELSKVNWPSITPWFKPESKVWGATYVVLIVVAALTLYVFSVDLVLQSIANFLFYGSPS
jgi:preprotein translocase subunit SecE